MDDLEISKDQRSLKTADMPVSRAFTT